jgi:hypothetical protein
MDSLVSQDCDVEHRDIDAQSKSLGIIYRILGNDLPPRHGTDQTINNLRFILEHERSFEDLKRFWIVNRFICSQAELRVIDILKEAGESFLHLPFDLEEYSKITPNFSHFEQPDYQALWSGEVSDAYKRILLHDHAFHEQNRYVMNVNGARNVALRHGRKQARWVLPWDGNCFLTEDGWSAIRAGMQAAEPGIRYLVVPMERILDNADLLNGAVDFPALEEPQLAFRDDAGELFDEELRYGRFSKVELLRRLGVPGVWDGWDYQPWEARSWTASAERGAWRIAGWVARLASGQPDFDRDASAAGIRFRSLARRSSIRAGIQSVDRQLVAKASEDDPGLVDSSVIDRVSSAWRDSPELVELVERADRALARAPSSVLDKSECAPNGDRRCYYSVAPYWWPDSAGSVLPYVRRDGVRNPEAELNAPESLRYDSTRLQNAMDDIFVLAWAAYVTRAPEYAAKAIEIIDAWFCDRTRAMRPSLEFAQVRRGRPRTAGQPSGIIDARDMYLVVEAVRVLNRMGAVPDRVSAAFRSWASAYLDWLLTSSLGRSERQALNNHGTCYEMQVLSLSLFLGRSADVIEAVNRARSRIFQQFDSEGRQPMEAERRTPLHYALFNLQSCMIVARLSSLSGMRMFADGDAAEQLLRKALHRVSLQVSDWRKEVGAVEIWSDDETARLGGRLEPILAGAAHFGLAPAPAGPRFHPDAWPHPYSGIPPLWQFIFPSPIETPPSCALARGARP